MLTLFDQFLRGTPLGVIPAVAPRLPVVLAIVAGLLVALAGLLVSLFRPSTAKPVGTI